MKPAVSVVLGSALALCLGCNESEPGGPGATKPNNTNQVTGAPRNETFRISAPATTTTLKQGEQKEVSVTIDRSSDFKQDVTMTFKGDSGVNVTPATTTVPASNKDNKVKMTVSADPAAPIGEATIHVTGKPDSGNATSVDFKVDVKGK
jgi:uncharacterized membrane protein